MSKRIAVIGAGAAGLIAAGRAAECGNQVFLFEKNDRAGKKLSITGKGRCNITNDCDIEELIENTPGNGTFLYSSFYTFSNSQIIDFFKSLGLEIKVERGNRVFPASDNANDVVSALLKYVKRNKVEISYSTSVRELVTGNEGIKAILSGSGRSISFDAVILATGGLSYPGTGSSGDGYRMAVKLGHSIVDPKPSLVPLKGKEEWIERLQGLSLKNISITLKNIKTGKAIYKDFGEMLFTHDGVSGPVILSASRHIMDMEYKDVKLIIDLKPALSAEALDKRLVRDFEKYSRKQFKNALTDLLPKKMIPVIIDLSGINEDKFVNQISKQERLRLNELLKSFSLEIAGAYPIDAAIVTAGGISVKEIDPSSMESKIVDGLYFAGEIMDVDAYTGGFNLTIAFSTGYLAGSSV